jgi:hypothetical protein
MRSEMAEIFWSVCLPYEFKIGTPPRCLRFPYIDFARREQGGAKARICMIIKGQVTSDTPYCAQVRLVDIGAYKRAWA